MMRPTRFLHGCFAAALSLLMPVVVVGQQPVPVRSHSFEIEYEVNEQAMPLGSVHLWYTLDRGETWQDFGEDMDRRSPVTFQAAQEGLYGFFLVLTNATGPSSTPPTAGSEPLLWAFVDYTPPVVQLHPPRQTEVLGEPVLQIAWTAIDEHFGARPVEITYRPVSEKNWQTVTPEPIANTSRYEWRLPESLSGPIALRVSVEDRVGQHTDSDVQIVEVKRKAYDDPGGLLSSNHASGHEGSGQSAREVSPDANQEAQRLFDQAMARRERGEYREGIARLREAIRLKPQWTQAFVEMGDMLYRIGDSDRALGAFQIALRYEPTMRRALRGIAKVYRQKNDSASAAHALRTILQHRPNDAEVWMNLGDIAVYQGDEVLARYCYTRASRVDPTAVEVMADARKRLALMAAAGRTYKPNGR